MFNLLWLRDTTQKVTGIWNFDDRCGECCSYRNTSNRCQFFSWVKKTTSYNSQQVSLWRNLLWPLTLCQELPTQMLYVSLLDLKESALLITANDTDVHCRRALFNNESIFLSPGRDAYYWWLEQITACFLSGQHWSEDTTHESNSGVKTESLFMTFIYYSSEV